MPDSPARLAGLHLAAATRACGRGAVALLLLLQLAAALTEALALALLLPMVELVAGEGAARLPVVGAVVTPPLVVTALITAVLARATAQWAATVHANEVRMATTDAVRLETLTAVFDADWRHLTGQRRSHLVQSLTTEVLRVGAALDILIRMAVATLLLAATAAVAVLVAPILGALAGAAALTFALLARGSLGRASSLGLSLSERIAAFGAAVTDSLAAVRVIRAHDAARPWTDLISREAAAGREVQRRYVRSAAGLRAVLGVFGVFAAVGLVMLGDASGLSGAQLVVLAVVASRLLNSAQSLVSLAQQFLNLAPALVRIDELAVQALRHREPPSSGGAGARSQEAAALVELRDVTVAHPERGTVLREVTLEIPRTGLTVLFGPSGAGKSTLLDVVLGLLRPDSGSVLVDGVPLTDARRWRARVGYVPQEVVLVPGTVLDNLVWSAGRPVTEAEAWESLAQAHLEETVRQLRHGLHSPLRDFTELSGGEQQRLCLARALVRQPDLLLLDEATSALDPATESAVLTGLAAAGRATLLVTHRESPVELATSVARLEAGRLSVVRIG